jgi:hypothetical protein
MCEPGMHRGLRLQDDRVACTVCGELRRGRVLNVRDLGGSVRKLPSGVVYVGRPSIWANPFTTARGSVLEELVVDTPEEAVLRYAEWMAEPEQKPLRDRLAAIAGRDLACWCAPEACHGQVLAGLSLVAARARRLGA